MKKFRINKYITLKLEDGTTNIYVNNEYFNQCKYLLLDIPLEKISSFDEIDSIDEAAEKLDNYLENADPYEFSIPSETEFWGHCSNMQVWYENNYNTRLLHSNLAFPLLKKLTEAGDPLAIKVFKKEILKRIESGSNKTIEYLLSEGYQKYFNDDYYHLILDDDADVLLALEAELGIKLYYSADSCFEKSFIVENRSVKQLNLTYCELRSIPSIIRKLSNLKAIYLYGNVLCKLPDWIEDLMELEWIDVSSNYIVSLPESIGNLKKLYHFDISFNRIDRLPESMSQLNNLKTLKLKGNLINFIPKSLNNIKHLIVS
ncbi:MAG: leucine-rich repeat domain-containing protein [Promethearchaeota archaeon]|nr:MAG: leucine-rich repeat domain-containing protein [Candidatus Lokiarchaeota archaeon]